MSHLILSLDGNIGAGKSTLLEQIRTRIPNVHVVEEPVGLWTSLKNDAGKSLLELFYEDKKRWAYTFQNCAIMTRFRNIQDAIQQLDMSSSVIPKVVITERSILTDKHVFAEMLRESGDLDRLEWELYECWFTTFSKKYPVHGIIYLSTSSVTSKERISIRNRAGEEKIQMDYLDALDQQHKKWVEGTTLPVLTLSTERDVPVEENLAAIQAFVETLKERYFP